MGPPVMRTTVMTVTWLMSETSGIDAGAPDDQAPGTGTGTDSAEAPVESNAEDERAVAARLALARAQRNAAERGFRPGSRPAPRRSRSTQSFTPSSNRDGRDPQLIDSTMKRLLLERGWNVDVAAGAVMSRWADLVGAGVAEHARPLTFEDGVLIVRAESTAWATQLQLLTASLLASIADGVGEGVVNELRVVGPSAPSWVRGPRRVAGRGPRDTYG